MKDDYFLYSKMEKNKIFEKIKIFTKHFLQRVFIQANNAIFFER